MPLELLRALGARLVLDVVQRNGLASGTQRLGAPSALQGLGQVVCLVMPVRVTPRGQALRTALARAPGLADRHARHARDGTAPWGALAMHRLHSRVPGLHRGGHRGKQPLAVAPSAAEPAPLLLGTEGPSAQPIGVPAVPPLASEPSGCGPARGALGLAGIAQEHLQAPGRQQLTHGTPGDPGRCHGPGGHATVQEPVGQGGEGGGARAETAHGLGGTPRGHGAPGRGVADVKASRVRVADLQRCGAPRGLREPRRREQGPRGQESVWVGCPGSLRAQDTDAGEPWGRESRQHVPSPKRDQDGAWPH